jgi:hypothetical protein
MPPALSVGCCGQHRVITPPYSTVLRRRQIARRSSGQKRRHLFRFRHATANVRQDRAWRAPRVIETDLEFDGDTAANADSEPSLGSIERLDQTTWSHGRSNNAEDEHDGAEPSLGALTWATDRDITERHPDGRAKSFATVEGSQVGMGERWNQGPRGRQPGGGIMTHTIIPFPGRRGMRRAPSPEIASYFTFIWAEFDRLMDLFTYEGLSLDAMVKM